MPVRKTKKAPKSFGPMIKLNVPNFDRINKHFEILKNEHNGAKKKGKTTNMSYGYMTRDEHENTELEESKNGHNDSLEPPKDFFTQPKQSKQIDNPWIDKAVHEEVLERKKGLPARAKKMVENKKIVKTFIQTHEPTKADEQTLEALKLLEAENEIFTTPDLPPTTFLPRFDLAAYDEKIHIPEMVRRCQEKPDQVHALSPTYQNYEYVWKPVYVLDFENDRWKVRDQASGNIKYVTRLSLLFLDEDPAIFLKRVKDCKILQHNVNSELQFTALVDSISADNVSILSKEKRFNLLKKSMREKTDVGREQIAGTFKKLLRIVEEEYVRQMKKCIILKEMQNYNTHARFSELKVPVRLPSRSARYLAVVPIPKFEFQKKYEDFSVNHWNKDINQVKVTEKLVIRSLKRLEERFMKTDRVALKLPKELKDLISIQNSHHNAVKQNISVQWRDYFVAEIQDDLKETHDFYEPDIEVYRDTELKRIVTRFELLLHTYLREFVKNSIDDWVGFIKSFTQPNYEKGELWRLSESQMLIIHLTAHSSKKKKKDKKHEKSPEKGDEGSENTIRLQPSLEECATFLKSAFDKIITATNEVKFLESELMPFLKDKNDNEDSDEDQKADEEGKGETEEAKNAKAIKDEKKDEADDKNDEDETPVDEKTGERLGPRRGPNFKLDHEFIWIKEGLAEVDRMINENVHGPTELLNKYRQFETILKSSKSEKVNSLFEPKQPIESIREQIEFYDKTYYDILNTSNDQE